MTKQKSYFITAAIFVLVSVPRTATGAECLEAPTSEGLVTMSEGQYACAQLRDGQSADDLGKSYVMCLHGRVFALPCPGNLRWDTTTNHCNFPDTASCKLTQKNIAINPTTDPRADTPTADATREEDRPPERPWTTEKPRQSSTPIVWVQEPASEGGNEYLQKTTKTTGQPSRTRQAAQPDTITTPTTVLTNVLEEKTPENALASVDCRNARTSEGPRNLRHGQRACAYLGNNKDDPDYGRQFVTCSFGQVYTQECQYGLRYDTASGFCNWPAAASCEMESYVPEDKALTPTDKSSAVPERPATAQQTSHPRPTGRCNANNCKLPNCFCFGDTPSGIPTADTPMFIMLTFDDALTASLYDRFYRALLVDNDYKLHNPNGCRIKSAFYVSHEYTDYSKVKALWNAGNEIGSHTIHHKLPQGDRDGDYAQMVAEIQGLKDEMMKATKNQTLVDSIVGFRAPYLRVAGDVQYKVLHDHRFLYDTSILNINNLQRKKPHWPYTLDHAVGECVNPPCPKRSYPGLWEVPLNGWVGDDRQGCSMVDACVVGTSPWSASQEQWYKFYSRNFKDYFHPTKVPMPIFTHGFLFSNYPNSYAAMAKWFQVVLQTHNDVWLVTPAQVIAWMKNPLSSKEMAAQRWGC